MRVFKVCLLGAFAVGKTSLVRRFVSDVFSDRYLTTIGVKIEKREVRTERGPVRLVLWDLHGEDRFQHVDPLYLRGAAGVLVTVDPTRPETVASAAALSQRARAAAPGAVQLVALNKRDLEADWAPAAIREAEGLLADGVHRVSAKTGEGVEAAFEDLAQRLRAGAG